VLIALVGCAALLQPPVANARSAGLRACERLVLSPAYATDGTAYCAGMDRIGSGEFRLYVTKDHARTWAESAGNGVVDSGGLLEDFAVSPAFPHDRMLVVVVSQTVYVSTDAGATFTSVPHLAGRVALDTVPGAGPVPAHGVVVGAGGAGPPGTRVNYVFDPVLPSLRLAPGSGTGRDVAFVIAPGSPDRDAFVVAAGGDTAQTATQTLYACDAAFTCTAQRAALPAKQTFDRAWFASDYASSGTLFVSTVDASARAHVFVSRDRGRTLAPVAALESALKQSYAAGGAPFVALAPGRAASRTVFARVSGGTERAQPPAERLFRSDDGGRSWRLTAFGRSPYAPGARGTMPYSYTYLPGPGTLTPLGLLTFADGTLLMSGRAGYRFTVWCSADSGRTWSGSCR
jgi:hypothetical protein